MSTPSETETESTSSFEHNEQQIRNDDDPRHVAVTRNEISQSDVGDPRAAWNRRSSSGLSRNVTSTRSVTQFPVQDQPDVFGFTSPPLSGSDMSSEARRQSIMAMDRKRRLTSSNQDGGRRRLTPDAFHERDEITMPRRLEAPSSSARPPHRPSRHSSGHASSPSEVVDLTRSPPAATAILPSATRRPSTSNQRVYVVPRWQPDAEVSQCPICKRSFGLFFRRHHCRKCGRVVCNECSPHRITIPRQFIVNPPGLDIPSSPVTDTIDLTREYEDHEDNEHPSNSANSHRYQTSFSTIIGGGEKVRLCNPCVPDPQPEPHPLYGSGAIPVIPSLPGFGSLRGLPDPLQLARHRHHHRDSNQPFTGMSAPDYTSLASQYERIRTHRPHPNILDSSTYGMPLAQGSLLSRHSSERQHDRSRPILEGPFLSHGRYQSLDSTRSPQSPSARSQNRWMSDNRFYPPRISSTQFTPVRPQLNEDDICPICRRALPSRQENGDETAREAHIVDCINARDPATSSSLSRSHGTGYIPQRGPMHMLTFVATEKDCVSEDGNTPECSICMVEYDVGDQLARLECLCKFHKECIVSWFERKQECPLHKIA